MEAFLAATTEGCDGVELDIHATADGELVVHHDPVLPDGRALGEHTWRELTDFRLQNGEGLPRLEEIVPFAGRLFLWIEVKALPVAADRHLLALITSSPAPARCGVHSFDHRIIRRLRGTAPGLTLGALSASYPVDPVAATCQAGASVLWQEQSLIDGPLVDAAHAAGLQVIAWTVNNGPRAETLAGLGVDGLCGNFPERLRVQ